MLVLSRKPNEKILLPALDIAVQVVSINKSSVRLGIQAPAHVAVLREELQARQANWSDVPRVVPVKAPRPQEMGVTQLLGNRLRVASTGLAQLRRLVEAGRFEEVLEVVDKIEEDFTLLRRRLESESVPNRPHDESSLVGAHL